MSDNSLALGDHYCPTCGTQLDRRDRPCPMGCEREGRK